jgi:hypothetical protein
MNAQERQDMLQAIAALDCRGLVVPEDVSIQVVHAMPEIAAAAYQVYRSAFPEAGVLMPEFAELPTLVKDAWAAVAAKILTYAPAISAPNYSRGSSDADKKEYQAMLDEIATDARIVIATHPQETPQ